MNLVDCTVIMTTHRSETEDKTTYTHTHTLSTYKYLQLRGICRGWTTTIAYCTAVRMDYDMEGIYLFASLERRTAGSSGLVIVNGTTKIPIRKKRQR